MRIYRNGTLFHDSIDNTGATDGAALGARYAKGLIETLATDLEDNHYTKEEVVDLLSQKSEAKFVDELPATLAESTWYYSRKFDDGTDVPNDKRALYAKDAFGVTQYLGVIGDIDLSDYYTKAQSDARYEPLIEARAPLACDYFSTDLNSAINADDCVFDLLDSGITGSSVKVAQRQIFIGYMPAGADPISSSTTHYGTVETIEYFDSSGNNLHIEQRFVKRQSGNFGSRYEFYRKGNLTLEGPQAYKSTVYSRRAEISWKAWTPVMYPKTQIYSYDNGLLWAAVRGGMCYLDLSGNFTPRYTSGNQHIIAYVTPTSLRPALEVHGTVQGVYGQKEGEITTFWIQTNGEVKCFSMTDWTNFRGSIVYPIGY